jgi:hypothetical protein
MVCRPASINRSIGTLDDAVTLKTEKPRNLTRSLASTCTACRRQSVHRRGWSSSDFADIRMPRGGVGGRTRVLRDSVERQQRRRDFEYVQQMLGTELKALH